MRITFSTILWLVMFSSHLCAQTMEITADDLRDKITGGLLGQFFGNLNGLVHENKYFAEPGNVREYTPDLSDGAFTDDDTDIEFVYIYHMVKADETMLPYDRIRELWIENINTKIWCSNLYARNMMDLGFQPPMTGRIAFNPWAVFNISGQFLCEEFALIAPGMPTTAARLGTHYTHVAIDAEPTQSTQLYDAMIASAFFESDHRKLIDAGLAAIDPQSEIHAIVSNVIQWHDAHPADWRATRLSIKNKYWNGTWGSPGGSNGYRTITAATIGALLHGNGDFVETIRLAFNFGWDADNIASMVGTIVGVLKGEKWIRDQGWKIKDEYRNTRRPGLPTDLTITDFADLHLHLAAKIILENGGETIEINGLPGYRIKLEAPTNIETLPNPLTRIQELRDHWWSIILQDISGTGLARARVVYATLCLDLVEQVASKFPKQWRVSVSEFAPHYEKLFGNEQWSEKERDYFDQVIRKGNMNPESPFGYGAYITP